MAFARASRNRSTWPLIAACGFLSLSNFAALADSPTSQPASPSAPKSTPSVAPSTQPAAEPKDVKQPPHAAGPAVEYPPIVVEAERREQSAQDVPASVTTVNSATIQANQIEGVKDASNLVPNLYVSQFTPPRVSNPYIRGIGSGQNAPGVATYIDGVPQLSYSTSNIAFVDIDRLEFLRGPQSTLYGRSALGGVINVYNMQPGNAYEGDLQLSGGSYSTQDFRGGVRGPIVEDQAYFAIAGGWYSRDGFNKNLFTGDNLDNRNDLFGRFELRFTPTADWDLRLTFNGEQNHDGDFPLADLAFLHQAPYRVDHDYTGLAQRQIEQGAFTALFHGRDVEFSSVTAVQYWREKENTDIDETPFNGVRRYNNETQFNYIEELRAYSPTNRAIPICTQAKFSWLAGAIFFAQNDHQLIDDQIESTSISGGLPVPLDNFQEAKTNIYGIGAYAQGTVTMWDKLDLTAGGRIDFEYDSAHLGNYSNSAFVPTAFYNPSRDDLQFSPQFSADYHIDKDVMPYATIARGFRAGGFNPIAPSPSQVAFNSEQSWSYEAGVKTSWLDNKVQFNADVFYIDWKNLQLNVPIPGAQSQFFIDNAGRAHSTGFEAEGVAHVTRHLDFFAGAGFTNARFDHYIQTNGVSAHGNRLPDAPEVTWNIGAQYTLGLQNGLRTYVRGAVIGIGAMAYDSTNALEQSPYTITNFRVGVAGDKWRLEGYVNNAFNTHYFPVAFPFPGTVSGYVGQEGDPFTMGVTLGYNF